MLQYCDFRDYRKNIRKDVWTHKHYYHNIEFPMETKIKIQAAIDQEQRFILSIFHFWKKFFFNSSKGNLLLNKEHCPSPMTDNFTYHRIIRRAVKSCTNLWVSRKLKELQPPSSTKVEARLVFCWFGNLLSKLRRQEPCVQLW